MGCWKRCEKTPSCERAGLGECYFRAVNSRYFVVYSLHSTSLLSIYIRGLLWLLRGPLRLHGLRGPRGSLCFRGFTRFTQFTFYPVYSRVTRYTRFTQFTLVDSVYEVYSFFAVYSVYWVYSSLLSIRGLLSLPIFRGLLC